MSHQPAGPSPSAPTPAESAAIASMPMRPDCIPTVPVRCASQRQNPSATPPAGSRAGCPCRRDDATPMRPCPAAPRHRSQAGHRSKSRRPGGNGRSHAAGRRPAGAPRTRASDVKPPPQHDLLRLSTGLGYLQGADFGARHLRRRKDQRHADRCQRVPHRRTDGIRSEKRIRVDPSPGRQVARRGGRPVFGPARTGPRGTCVLDRR